MYEILDHTADIKIRIQSINLFDFFRDLIFALKDIINYDSNSNSDSIKNLRIKNIKIVLSDFDDYQKIFNFISKFIYYLDAKSILIEDINYIKLKEGSWELNLKGLKIDKTKFKGYLKAPTYCDFNFKSQFYLEVIIDV